MSFVSYFISDENSQTAALNYVENTTEVLWLVVSGRKFPFFGTKEIPHVWLIMNREFSTRKYVRPSRLVL